ncbi:hypothetical protein C4579_01090 [Candidatus Microgenomates bacterium]|nr:MAG: hypothetical protein C4579_01090 [Candidatus Microgenomates bacterium]
MQQVKLIGMQTAALLAVLAVATAALVGTLTVPISAQVGAFTAVPTEFGIALMQKKLHTEYVFNAYNDYYIDTQGNRFAIVPFDENRKNIQTEKPQGLLADKFISIATYFANRTPAAHFYHVFDASYTTEITSNTLTITRSITNHEQMSSAQTIAATLRFERDDLVFDEHGILFSENADWQRQNLSERIGYKITSSPINERRPASLGKRIFVINPHAEGIMMIEIQTGQTAYINKTYKLIEIEQAHEGTSATVTLITKITILPQISDVAAVIDHETFTRQQTAGTSGFGSLLEGRL